MTSNLMSSEFVRKGQPENLLKALVRLTTADGNGAPPPKNEPGKNQ